MPSVLLLADAMMRMYGAVRTFLVGRWESEAKWERQCYCYEL